MPRRMVVFLDYQNVYRSARRTFDLEDEANVEGQVHPRTLAERICSRHATHPCELTEVRVYRGLPSGSHDPKGYAAAQRQLGLWRATSKVSVFARPLRYPPNYPTEEEREKGIDVALALDYVMMAVRKEYEVGVLFTADTDLVPALEQVAELPEVEAELAAWQPDDGYGYRLRLPGKQIVCHWLPRPDYEAARDLRDYTIKA